MHANGSEKRSSLVRSGLLLLFAVALVLRVWFLLSTRSYLLDHVTYEYGEIAANLVQGRGFSVRFLGGDGPTSSQAPVYPFFVAAFFWVFGVRTAEAVFWIQFAQAVIGSLLPLLIALLCWNILPGRPSVGWLSGLGVAFHPLFVYTPSHVQPVTLLSVLCATLFLAAARLRYWVVRDRRRTLFWCLVWGTIGGGIALTDPILTIVFAVTIAWVAVRVWKVHGFAPALSTAAIGTLAAASVISPWIVRNWVVHGELVPIKSTFGYALWQGNHPRSFGTDKIPRAYAEGLVATYRGDLRGLIERTWQARHETQYIDDLVLSPAEKRELGQLPEVQRCRLLLRQALGYIANDPGRYARLCLRRLRYFFLFDDTNPRTHVLAYRIFHLAFMAATLWGLWCGRSLLKPLAPLLAAYFALALFHSLTIVSIRFRIPVEPFQVIVAAIGAERLLAVWATTVRGYVLSLLSRSVPRNHGKARGATAVVR